MQFKFEERELRADELCPNDGQVRGVPRNPRFIRDSRFEALKKSIADTPQMLDLRELIVFPLYTGKFCILAGNMRFRAARELGILKFRCKIVPASTPAETLRAFVIKDNIAFGSDDIDALANDWDLEELRDFGFDNLPQEEKDAVEKAVDEIKDFGSLNGGEGKEEKESDDDGEDERVKDTIFPSDNEYGIPVLDLERMPTSFPEQPIIAYGERRGWLTEAKTLHFYIDDFRFSRLWRDPSLILGGSVKAFIEPNFSLYANMPRAYAYFATYKKRWLARMWQDCGLLPYVDLNVHASFSDINLLGVPKGWRAFAYRGDGNDDASLADGVLETCFKFTDKPILVIYSGGEKYRKWCEKHAQFAVFINELHTRNGYGEKAEK